MSPDGGSTDDLFPVDLTLVLNTDHTAVARLTADGVDEEKVQLVARHLYDMARLGHGTLDADGMAAFLARSATLLGEWQA